MKELIENHNALQKQIKDIIGYDSNNLIEDCRGLNWSLINNELVIVWNEEGKQVPCQYTISSYGEENDQLFTGKKDGYVFILAYEYEYDWDSPTVYVLDEKLEITAEEIFAPIN